MKTKLVTIPSIKTPIKKSPGFAKKQLATYKLDIMGLCGFGCRYCSSNNGNYLRINRDRFATTTEQQLGARSLPAEDPSLSFQWADFREQLEAQLSTKARTWGAGHVLVFSQLTDAFSPWAVSSGLTRWALEGVLQRTAFRIRVLTKSAVVAEPEWIDLFKAHPGRFVVGLSCGTLDDAWAQRVELGTSPPSERIAALRALQDAGVPTFVMMCPVFPEAVSDVGLMLAKMRPDRAEHVWIEPFNDRANWRHVADGYPSNDPARDRIEHIFSYPKAWSDYATRLYLQVLIVADGGGWAHKLRYLLYEGGVDARHAARLGGFRGLLLQGKPAAGGLGLSRNDAIAALQVGQ